MAEDDLRQQIMECISGRPGNSVCMDCGKESKQSLYSLMMQGSRFRSNDIFFMFGALITSYLMLHSHSQLPNVIVFRSRVGVCEHECVSVY